MCCSVARLVEVPDGKWGQRWASTWPLWHQSSDCKVRTRFACPIKSCSRIQAVQLMWHWNCAVCFQHCPATWAVPTQEYNEKVNVMLTTGSQDAYELLQASLPPRVIIQLVPLDNPISASLFMQHWRPQVGILMVRAGRGAWGG
jgi:hypothetical protein